MGHGDGKLLCRFDGRRRRGRSLRICNNEVSLVNNRHFIAAATSAVSALAIVQDHAPKFLSNHKGILKIETCELRIGTYYPNIARGSYPDARSALISPDFRNETMPIARVRREIALMSHDLEECFDVSSPDVRNLDVFGTTYETIIHFSCIGVESLFSRILASNEFPALRSTMNDFVKLSPFLKLQEYEVKLLHYPWLEAFRPFQNWNAKEPTGSLSWYRAYNKLKHEKMSSLHLATMRHAIESVLAYFLLSHAVFGSSFDTKWIADGTEDFAIVSTPAWGLQDYYFETADKSWRPIKLFSSSRK